MIVLIALLLAGSVLYWRITSSYSAATASARQPAAPTPAITTVPTMIGTLEVSSKIDFKCTLPVTAYSRRVRVALPSGSVTLDGVQSANGSAVGDSYRGGRWLPVPPAWVSPDGGSYAAPAQAAGSSTEQAIVLTNASTGERQEVWRGVARPAVVGWDSNGLYFMLQPLSTAQSGTSETGLWLTRPSSPGQANRIGPDSTSLAAISPARALFTGDAKVGGGAAWDTTQAVGASRARIERMDLQNGTVSVWYTAPAGLSLFILGFDRDGHPVLSLTGSDRSSNKGLLLLTAANQTVQIGGDLSGAPRFASALGDAQGIWIGASGSLWLYRGRSLFKVASVPVSALGGQSPMTIANASGGSGELPPARIGGACT